MHEVGTPRQGSSCVEAQPPLAVLAWLLASLAPQHGLTQCVLPGWPRDRLALALEQRLQGLQEEQAAAMAALRESVNTTLSQVHVCGCCTCPPSRSACVHVRTAHMPSPLMQLGS